VIDGKVCGFCCPPGHVCLRDEYDNYIGPERREGAVKVALIADTHSHLPAAGWFDQCSAILHAGDIGPDRGIAIW